MKSKFAEYYAPTDDEYKQLWDEALIVLDTNVLLDLYRIPATARSDLLALLEKLKNRLWVPYQVALEFQRRRLTVISTVRKATEDALGKANALYTDLEEVIAKLQMEKSGLGIDPGPLLNDLKGAGDKLVDAINTVHRSQPDIAMSDLIRSTLDGLLANRVGDAPADQASLEKYTEGGEERFSNRIPPGYSDADKDKNPAEATFFHDGLCYQRKFGDLILWMQVIEYAKANHIKKLLFVTADRKEDWWWREKGKTIGPRPELARELASRAGVELFWMYSTDQFLESAQRFAQAQVAKSSVSEIQEVLRHIPAGSAIKSVTHGYSARNALEMRYEAKRAEDAVYRWLIRKNAEVIDRGGFPDITVAGEDGPHGYEVKLPRTLMKYGSSNLVELAIAQGYVEVKERRLWRYSLVLIVSPDDWEMASSEAKVRTFSRLERAATRSPIYEVIIAMLVDDDIKVLWQWKDSSVHLSEWLE